MRIPGIIVLLSVSLPFVPARTTAQSASQALQVNAESLFRTGELPLIFVGKMVQADLAIRPCRISCGIRWATYSVERVLYGFSPGHTVKIAYDSPSPPALFTSKSDLLIFALGGYTATWRSDVSLLALGSDDNIGTARRIAAAPRDRLLANFNAHHTNLKKVAFVGTVERLPELSTGIQPRKGAISFPVAFKIDEWLSEPSPVKEVTVVYAGCVAPPDPPFRVGAKMIVLAGEEPRGDIIGYFKDLLPENELEHVRQSFVVKR